VVSPPAHRIQRRIAPCRARTPRLGACASRQVIPTISTKVRFIEPLSSAFAARLDFPGPAPVSNRSHRKADRNPCPHSPCP
jgi:hypothetical protein